MLDRASAIARELLDFSRQSESKFTAVNIAGIITDVISLLEYKRNNIKIYQKLQEVP